jgi:putative FmdB family regulatory protein
MPTYEYRAVESGCDHCRQVFEVRQTIRSQPLRKCPECGAAVRRLISRVMHFSPKPSFSYDRAADAGFTAYEKTPGGLKKIAGGGPEMPITDGNVKDLA